MQKIIVITLALFVSACATQYPNQNPVGQPFPTVTGQSLEKQPKQLPKDLPNEPVVLLLGYVQDAQFDIDRWFIGLDMTKTPVTAMEIPTIQGMFPRMFKTQIDDGMRSGIPKELWGGVITVYKDGAKLQQFTGNDRPNNARVLLLDSDRNIAYFHDRGFSVLALNELRKALRELVP